MIQFTVNGKEYVAVEVPEEAIVFTVGNEFLQSYPTAEGDIKLKRLPSGSYSIIGKVGDIGYDTITAIVGKWANSASKFKAICHLNNLSDNHLILERK